MLCKSALDPSLYGQGTFGCKADQIEQALENLVKFVIAYIVYQKKMELVVAGNEVGKGFRISVKMLFWPFGVWISDAMM